MSPRTDSPPAPQGLRTRRRLGRGPAFVLVSALVLLFLAASAAPSPLYPAWAARWGASPSALTAVFAVYALTLLAALAVFGRLSDVVGRRPVLLAAVALELASLVVFLAADGVALLLVARAAQGVATGLAIGTAGAALLDLEPPGRRGLGALVNSAAPTFGLALGAFGSGAVVEVSAAPAPVVFTVLTTLFAVLLLAVALLPESAGAGGSRRLRRAAALRSLRPRVAVPGASRRRFAAAVPVFVATWALGALQLSLGPEIARDVLGLTHPLAGAALLASFSASSGVVAVATSRTPSALLERWGAVGLAVGTLLDVAGLATASLPVFAAGLLVAGAGFGACFSGALRSVVATAPPEHRAGLLTSVYVVSYLAFSLPAVLAGELVSSFGLLAVAVGYGVVVVALAVTAVVLGARSAAPGQVQHPAGDRKIDGDHPERLRDLAR